MDPVTHIIIGLFLGFYIAGKMKFTDYRLPVIASLLGAILPDLDAVAMFIAKGGFFAFHRTITHSLLGALVLAVIMALVLTRFKKGAIAKFAVISFVGVMMHLAVDFFTLPGIALFYPFSKNLYSLGFMPPFDLLLLVILAAGVIVIELKPNARIKLSGFMLLLIFGFGCAKFVEYKIVEADIKNDAHFSENNLKLVPNPLNPFKWRAIASNNDLYYIAEYNVFSGVTNVEELKKQESLMVEKSKESIIVQRLIKKIIPYAIVEGNSVKWIDLRYSTDGSRGYTAMVVFNDNLEIVEEVAGY